MNNLKPFKRFCITLGEIPSSYLESMSYYETLVWLCNYLNKTIEPSLKETQEAVIELQEFVSHYFDNLDVQDEINNKLDEMAEDGTLDEMITSYINLKSILCFNNVNEMKNATNLIDGSFVKTYGFYNYNDNGGAYYKIRNIINTDVVDEMFIIALNDNNLVAELVINDKLHILQLGAKGNGTNDDKNIIQAGLNYCGTNKKVLYFDTPSNFYKINSGLIVPSGIAGIECEKWDYSGIIRTETDNITMITIKPTMGAYFKNLSIGGINRPTSNGILFEGHTGINEFNHIRIYNLDGYGFKINAIWDSLLEDISIELCGNVNEYAFSMLSDGDTSNESNINRLQVEQSYTKAILIEDDTLCCNFTNIHSERTNNADDSSYILGGYSCNYDVIRLNINNEEVTECVKISGTKTTFNNLQILGNIKTNIQSYLLANVITNSIISNVFERNSQVIDTLFENCKIYNFENLAFSKINNCAIDNLKAGYLPANVFSKVYNSDIGEFTITSTNAKVIFENSKIQTLQVAGIAYLKLINCTINELKDNYYGYSNVEAINSTFNTSITSDFVTSRFNNVTINGDLSYLAGGNLTLLTNCKVTGSVSPFFTSAPIGSGLKGDIHNNLNVTTGQPTGWVYNGTNWVALPNFT